MASGAPLTGPPPGSILLSGGCLVLGVLLAAILVAMAFYRAFTKPALPVPETQIETRPAAPSAGKGIPVNYNPVLHDIVVAAEHGIDLVEKDGTTVLTTLEKGAKIVAADLGKTVDEVFADFAGLVTIAVKPFRVVPHPAPAPGEVAPAPSNAT